MHMERSAVNKNRCIALKDCDRLCVHAKYHQTGDQAGLHTGFFSFEGGRISRMIYFVPVYMRRCHAYTSK